MSDVESDWLFGNLELQRIVGALLADLQIPLFTESIDQLRLNESLLVIADHIGPVPNPNSSDSSLSCAVHNGLYKSQSVLVEIWTPHNLQDQIAILFNLSVVHALPEHQFVKVIAAGYKTRPDGTSQVIVVKNFLEVRWEEYVHSALPWRVRLQLAWELTQSLYHLHKRKLTIRGFSSVNVFIGADGCVRLNGVFDKNAFAFDHSMDVSRRRRSLVAMYSYNTNVQQYGQLLLQLIQDPEQPQCIRIDCPERLQALTEWCVDEEPLLLPTMRDCLQEMQLLAEELGSDDGDDDDIEIVPHIRDSPKVEAVPNGVSLDDQLIDLEDESSVGSPPPPPPLSSPTTQPLENLSSPSEHPVDVIVPHSSQEISDDVYELYEDQNLESMSQVSSIHSEHEDDAQLDDDHPSPSENIVVQVPLLHQDRSSFAFSLLHNTQKALTSIDSSLSDCVENLRNPFSDLALHLALMEAQTRSRNRTALAQPNELEEGGNDLDQSIEGFHHLEVALSLRESLTRIQQFVEEINKLCFSDQVNEFLRRSMEEELINAEQHEVVNSVDLSKAEIPISETSPVSLPVTIIASTISVQTQCAPECSDRDTNTEHRTPSTVSIAVNTLPVMQDQHCQTLHLMDQGVCTDPVIDIVPEKIAGTTIAVQTEDAEIPPPVESCDAQASAERFTSPIMGTDTLMSISSETVTENDETGSVDVDNLVAAEEESTNIPRVSDACPITEPVQSAINENAPEIVENSKSIPQTPTRTRVAQAIEAIAQKAREIELEKDRERTPTRSRQPSLRSNSFSKDDAWLKDKGIELLGAENAGQSATTSDTSGSAESQDNEAPATSKSVVMEPASQVQSEDSLNNILSVHSNGVELESNPRYNEAPLNEHQRDISPRDREQSDSSLSQTVLYEQTADVQYSKALPQIDQLPIDSSIKKSRLSFTSRPLTIEELVGERLTHYREKGDFGPNPILQLPPSPPELKPRVGMPRTALFSGSHSTTPLPPSSSSFAVDDFDTSRPESSASHLRNSASVFLENIRKLDDIYGREPSMPLRSVSSSSGQQFQGGESTPRLRDSASSSSLPFSRSRSAIVSSDLQNIHLNQALSSFLDIAQRCGDTNTRAQGLLDQMDKRMDKSPTTKPFAGSYSPQATNSTTWRKDSGTSPLVRSVSRSSLSPSRVSRNNEPDTASAVANAFASSLRTSSSQSQRIHRSQSPSASITFADLRKQQAGSPERQRALHDSMKKAAVQARELKRDLVNVDNKLSHEKNHVTYSFSPKASSTKGSRLQWN